MDLWSREKQEQKQYKQTHATKLEWGTSALKVQKKMVLKNKKKISFFLKKERLRNIYSVLLSKYMK